MRKFAPISPPASSPLPALSFSNDFDSFSTYFTDSIPIPKSLIEIVTVSLTAGLLLISVVAFSFIVFLKLKSRKSHYLQSFNSAWVIRLLLVLLVSLWGFNEILSQPFMRAKLGKSDLVSETLQRQESFCKIRSVLDLGIFEPGFLISLLFLVKFSSKEQNPSAIRSLFSVFVLCTPSILLQIFLVFSPPFVTYLPSFFHGSSILSTDIFGTKTVLCTCPFFSWAIFAAFAVIYAITFLVSCGRVTTFVINKGLRRRIYVVAGTVVVMISLQIVLLGLSWMWAPGGDNYAWVMLAIFVCVSVSMAVAEFNLVITPVREALEAADCGLWSFNGGSRRKIAGDFSTPR